MASVEDGALVSEGFDAAGVDVDGAVDGGLADVGGIVVDEGVVVVPGVVVVVGDIVGDGDACASVGLPVDDVAVVSDVAAHAAPAIVRMADAAAAVTSFLDRAFIGVPFRPKGRRRERPPWTLRLMQGSCRGQRDDFSMGIGTAMDA